MLLFWSKRVNEVDFDSESFTELFNAEFKQTSDAGWTPLMWLC